KMIINRKIHQNRQDKLLSWLFLIPVLLILVVAAFIPLAFGLGLSVTNYEPGIENTQFVGLANYVRLFTAELFQQSVRNNILFALMAVGLELIFGTFLAIIISHDSRGNRLLTTIVLIPMTIAPVAAGILWRLLLDRTYGAVNYFLSFFGVEAIGWLSDHRVALYSIAMVDFWQFTPFVAILIVSSIKGVPRSFVEAALADGASQFKIIYKIVLPMIAPTLVIVAMIRFIDAFKVFGTVFVMTGGGPGNATLLLPNYIYQEGIRFFKVGFSSAIAMVFIAFMFLLAGLFIKLRNAQMRRFQ
ncbi:MAG: carbohydrate ABC transporter permease, partial [Alkalispirochaetaceae bacterium]